MTTQRTADKDLYEFEQWLMNLETQVLTEELKNTILEKVYPMLDM